MPDYLQIFNWVIKNQYNIYKQIRMRNIKVFGPPKKIIKEEMPDIYRYSIDILLRVKCLILNKYKQEIWKLFAKKMNISFHWICVVFLLPWKGE